MTYWSDVLNHALLFGILAIALNLLVGYAGYLSLAHAGFFGIGAYAAALAEIHWHSGFLLSTLIAVVVSAVAGALLAFPAIRISGEYVVLLTLAFLEVINQVEVAWIGTTGGATGLFPIPGASLFGYGFVSPQSYLVLFAIVAVVVLAICMVIVRSPFGRLLRGLREDARATRALGKDVVRAAVIVFAVTTGIAGGVGSLWAHYFNFITPQSFTLNQTILIAAMVVIGGVASLWGSLLGALLLVLLSALLTKVNVGEDDAAVIQQIIYGLALIVFMRFRPAGIIDVDDHRPREYARRVVQRLRSRGEQPNAAAEEDVPPRTDEPADRTDARPVPHPPGPALTATGIAKSFGGLRALDGVDVALQPASITILVGANGAGKTTLFNVLTGDTRPDRGEVTLWGHPITGLRANRVVQRGMARSFQDVRLMQQMTVLDNVALACQGNAGERLTRVFATPRSARRSEANARSRARECLASVGLEAEAHRAAGELSYGQQKLLAIARLLATECRVLLLDEPSSGVDPRWVDRVLELIADLPRQGLTVCLVEHSLDVINRLPAHAYFLAEGRIVSEGTVSELMAQPELVSAYFGTTP